ncbi:MAG TPA: sigma-70 family RNA polymerase sigma factor [Anaeromyxobacteraceae bacterium]|nr:sigma-70 family RNA polymerase sigma factor [Anaeromyxobacteraceae bacterium]
MENLETRVRQRLSAGDPDTAATLAIREMGPEVLGYLRAVLRDETDASDAFSLFAESTWRGLPGFRSEASLRTWLYRVAWSAALRLVRDPYRARRELLPTSAASRLAASVFASTAQRAEEERTAVQELRARLTPEEQSLLVLRLDRELSWREVAEVLAEEDAPKLDEAALRKRFERVKEKLGRLAREAGLLS